MLTVVICTCNRPEMLRDALDSVSRQTRLDCIEKILVSENGGNQGSRHVCESFPALPIEYVFQDPPHPIINHLRSLRTRIKTPFLAMLHDDDWWLSDHIESSVSAITATHSIAAFSNFAEAGSLRHPLVSSYKAPRIWAATEFDFSRDYIVLNHVQNFCICLMDTSYHYSTYVGDTNACWMALDQALASANIYDNDRTFPIFLGTLGSILYRPKVTAVVRTHPGQDSLRPIYYEKGGSMKAATTEWLLTNFPDDTREAATLFNEVVAPGLTDLELEGMMSYLPWEQKQSLFEHCGFNLHKFLNPPPNNLPGRFTIESISFRQLVAFKVKCRLKAMLTNLKPSHYSPRNS